MPMHPLLQRLFQMLPLKKKQPDGTLDLGTKHKGGPGRKLPDADVHKLMITATRIRREKGYTKAIEFLKELSSGYLAEQNTALVTCMNKLIPYMKREGSLGFSGIHDYMKDIMNKVSPNEPYFRNLHLTMADLIRDKDPLAALEYISSRLRMEDPDMVDFDLLTMAAELNIGLGAREEALRNLDQALLLLGPRMERYQHIKKLRKWHRTAAVLAIHGGNREGASAYLFHRFMEFCLDMARVLDPVQIEQFHQRKDLYFKTERGFENTEHFRTAIEILELQEQQEKMIAGLYGFVFEEMPALLKVSHKQLHFKPGDPESIAELQEKKSFALRPFSEAGMLEDHIRHWLSGYLSTA